MKKNVLMGVLLTTLLVSISASAHAQSRARVVADIPFNFQIGDQTLPAGEYVVDTALADGASLLIINKESGKGQAALTIAASSKQSNRPRMVFHKYGNQYFLRGVWSVEREGRSLMESGRERKLRRELRAMAKHTDTLTEPEIVVVSAR